MEKALLRARPPYCRRLFHDYWIVAPVGSEWTDANQVVPGRDSGKIKRYFHRGHATLDCCCSRGPRERPTEFLPKDRDLVCTGTASLREVEGHVVKALLEYQRPFAGALITAKH